MNESSPWEILLENVSKLSTEEKKQYVGYLTHIKKEPSIAEALKALQLKYQSGELDPKPEKENLKTQLKKFTEGLLNKTSIQVQTESGISISSTIGSPIGRYVDEKAMEDAHAHQKITGFNKLNQTQQKEVILNSFATVQSNIAEKQKKGGYGTDRYGSYKDPGSTVLSCITWAEKKPGAKTTTVHFATANLADTSAFIYVRNKTTGVITKKERLNKNLHKPTDHEELQRITAKGGRVNNERLVGLLAVSRAFGDISYESAGLSHEPDISFHSVEISENEEVLLEISCDGRSEKIGKQSDIAYGQAVIEESFNKDPSGNSLSKDLVGKAVKDGSTDNISVMIKRIDSNTPLDDPEMLLITDGHGGDGVAKDVAESLPGILQENVNQLVEGSELTADPQVQARAEAIDMRNQFNELGFYPDLIQNDNGEYIFQFNSDQFGSEDWSMDRSKAYFASFTAQPLKPQVQELSEKEIENAKMAWLNKYGDTITKVVKLADDSGNYFFIGKTGTTVTPQQIRALAKEYQGISQTQESVEVSVPPKEMPVSKFEKEEKIIANGFVQSTTSKRNAQCNIEEKNGIYKITIDYEHRTNDLWSREQEVYENLGEQEFRKYVEYYGIPHGPETRGNKKVMLSAYLNNVGTLDKKFMGKYNANTVTQTNGSEHYLSEGPTFKDEYGSSISRYFNAFFFRNPDDSPVKPISHILVAGQPIENGKLKFRNYFDPSSDDFKAVQKELSDNGFVLSSKAIPGNPKDTIKDYEVTISKGGVSHTFTAHHATDWPDFELPNFTPHDIQKLAAVNQEVAEKQEGLIIHCAAGLGRTGTLERALNPDKTLEELRQIRPGLVQEPTQYVFADNLRQKILDAPLDKIFNESKSKDPFASPISPAYKQIKDISIHKIVDYVLSNPDKAEAFFGRKIKGVATLAGRNFRKELANQPELLEKLINSGEPEITNAIKSTQLLKTSHLEESVQQQMEKLIQQFDQIPKMPTQSDINSIKDQLNGIQCEELKNILIQKANGLENCEPLPTPQEMANFVEKFNMALEKYGDIMPLRYEQQILPDLKGPLTRLTIDHTEFPREGFKPDEKPSLQEVQEQQQGVSRDMRYGHH